MQIATPPSSRAPGRTTCRCAAVALASALLLVASSLSAWAGTLDRARETGTIRLGYRTDAQPFSSREGSGQPLGYSIDLCQKVVDAVRVRNATPGLKVEYVPVTTGDRFQALSSGRIDLLCGAATITLSRMQEVSFSIPIFPGGVGALLRRDAPSRMRSILAGRPEPERPRWRASLGQILEKRTFAVQAGTTTETWLRQKLDEFDIIAQVETVMDNATGVEDVVNRKADVYFGDRAILLDSANRNPSSGDLMVLERRFTHEPLALALPRGDEDFRLLIDRTLSDLYRSGDIGGIYVKHFGELDENAQHYFDLVTIPE